MFLKGLRRLIDKKLAVKQCKDMTQEYQSGYCDLMYSQKKLQKIRQKRLRALLHYAKEHSPWYKKVLATIDVAHFTEDRMSEIPILTKTILMENWDDIVTDRRLTLDRVEKHLDRMNRDDDTLYLLNRYHVLSTSGSSGKRGIFVYDWNEWNKYYLYATRYSRPLANSSKAPPERPIRKLKIAQVIVTNTVYAVYALAKTFESKETEKWYFPVTQPLNTIISGLNETQPDVIIGTPTTILKLCQEADAGNLLIEPRAISTCGESLYSPIRALIKNTWPNVRVFNLYGSSEGVVGRNCQSDSLEMHLNDDACIIQPVDAWNNPLAKGVVANKLLVTNLYNYTLPLIRYEFSDQLLFLDKQCDCGLAHQLIAEPQGRPEFDFIYFGTIFVHHLVFVTPLLLEKNVQEYQVIQTMEGADIKIVAIGSVNKNKLQQSICTKLGELGLVDPKVHILEVEKIEYPESGKLRRFLKMDTSS
ncbi:MAG: phenylacetate--CoA ligase family protein [Legionellales bacterium]